MLGMIVAVVILQSKLHLLKGEKMKCLKSKSSLIITALFLLIVGCGFHDKHSSQGEDTIPSVSSISPEDSSTGVSPNSKIAVTFSEAMDSTSITNITFNVKQNSNIVDGTITYTGTTATFTPTNLLEHNATYTVTLNSEILNVAGVPLEESRVWSFTTGETLVSNPPVVSSVYPLNAAIDVAINQTISVMFSTSMDASTVNQSTFTVMNGEQLVPGVISYSGTTALFTHAAHFDPNAIYVAKISKDVKDLAGNALGADFRWTFSTGMIPDVISPLVSNTSPSDSAIGVPLNQIVEVTFSEPMNATTITTANFMVMQGATPITGYVTYTDTTAKISPAVNLAPNTEYTASVSVNVEDLAGNSLDSIYVWKFTTGDMSAPTVRTTVPFNSEIDVALNHIISATFSKKMDPLTITNISFTVKLDSVNVLGTVHYVDSTATFTPSDRLLPGEIYTANITTAVKGSTGDSLLKNVAWSFTTKPAIANILGSMASYAGFGGSAGLTNQGIYSVLNGDIGTTAASTLVTGFHDQAGNIFTETTLSAGLVKGAINCAPPAPGDAVKFTLAQQALADATIAFNHFAGLPSGSDQGAGELGGLVLPPGTYTAAGGTFDITSGDLTLDGQNDPDAQWVFQMAKSLTVGKAGQPNSVILINGAKAKNVVWQVGSAATINGAGGGVMVGTILSYAGVSISTEDNAVVSVLNGRAISLNASVTVVNTVINVQ